MTNLNTRITKVIDTLITANALFTMLDVSNKVKADGGPVVYHTDIRDAGTPIVQLLVGRGYLKEEITVSTPNGPARAMLYYPLYRNPNDYKYRAQTSVNAGSIPAAIVSKPIQKNSQTIAQKLSSTASTLQTTFATSVRNDGKVEIPTAALVASGLLNESVNITFHPNSITIESGAQRKLYSGIRLGTESLAKSNLAKNKVLKFTTFSKKIVISHI